MENKVCSGQRMSSILTCARASAGRVTLNLCDTWSSAVASTSLGEAGLCNCSLPRKARLAYSLFAKGSRLVLIHKIPSNFIFLVLVFREKKKGIWISTELQIVLF